MAECQTSPLHSCELCGENGLTEDDMRSHMRIVHIEGSPACPFCDLDTLTPGELQNHVNSVHLDFLTPEGDDCHYLEGGKSPFGSLWELEKCAEAGMTEGLCSSPSSNPPESDFDTDTEEDTVRSVILNAGHSPIPKKLKAGDDPQRPDRAGLTLPLRQHRDRVLLPSSSASSLGSSSRATTSPTTTTSSYPPSSASSSRPASSPSPPASSSRCSLSEVAPSGSSSLTCPICPHTEQDPTKLQVHVNRAHLDDLSPAIQAECKSGKEGKSHGCPLCSAAFENLSQLETHFLSAHADGCSSPRKPSDSNGNICCPVCGETGWSDQQLQVHVESHFSSPAPISTSHSRDFQLAQELDRQEKQKQIWKEEKEFANLQAQYGMDNQGNFAQQGEKTMMEAVVKGKMSITDYYELQAGMAASSRSGVDDGSSVTPRITDVLLNLSNKSPGVKSTLMCSPTDHYSSTFGDKGWGCGFRNLQMLLSCLLTTTQYRQSLVEKIAGNKNLAGTAVGMPSIPKLQALIESGWRLGYDRPGCEQLGGKLTNTRKWIGGTEIYTFLTFCSIDAQIIDFHKPTGEGGSHPLLFEWVWSYFSRQSPVTPPLYLQHQGHSRTICGIEKLNNGTCRLLVLDPSHSQQNIRQAGMRIIRKNVASMKSGQYQIVAVVGLLEPSEQEARKHRPIASVRVPS